MSESLTMVQQGPGGSRPADRAVVPAREVRRWLAAVPAAAKVARRQTADMLSQWCLTGMAPAATLVVSELVANAVNACVAARAAGPDRLLDQIALRLADTGRRLTIEVFDAAPGVPTRQALDPMAETGRGLHLIELVATWVCYSTATGPGKIVRAVLDHDGPETGRDDGSQPLLRRARALSRESRFTGDEALLRPVRDGLLSLPAQRPAPAPVDQDAALSLFRRPPDRDPQP